MNQGYIYVGYDQKGLFKIGMTGDYKKRLKQIQNMNPNFNFFCVLSVDKPAIVEYSLHEKFSHNRCVGEWFELSPEDIEWILDKYLPKEIERPKSSHIFELWQDAVGEKEL